MDTNWITMPLWVVPSIVKYKSVGLTRDHPERSTRDPRDPFTFRPLLFGYPDQPGAWMMVDYPASYHNRAAGFSFADGHSEIKHWQDPRTTPVLKAGQSLNLNVNSKNNPDVFWMMDRTTRKM